MTGARSINCPACGGTLAIKAAGYSVTVGCQYCGSILDVSRPEVLLIQQYHQAVRALALPIGSRGKLRNVEWEVVGWLQRSDDEAAWDEYLLFNPYAGYRWLIHGSGEWTFGTMLTALPKLVGQKSADFNGERYRLDYPPTETRIDKVVGEFYWRARAGDTVDATLYRRGRAALGWERSGNDVSWTLIKPLPDHVVLNAFGKAGGGSRSSGARNRLNGRGNRVGAGYRAPRDDVADLSKMWVIWLGAIALIWLVFAVGAMGRQRATQAATIGIEQPTQTIALATLTLTRPYQVVTVDARSSDFVNKWVDLDFSLINRATQQSYNAYGLLEFYAGRDSDGHWTEGNRRALTKFAGVPAGTYDLVVDAKANNWIDPQSRDYTDTQVSAEPIVIRFTVFPNGMFWSNLLLFAILMFLPIAWFHFWRRQREGYRYRA